MREIENKAILWEWRQSLRRSQKLSGVARRCRCQEPPLLGPEGTQGQYRELKCLHPFSRRIGQFQQYFTRRLSRSPQNSTFAQTLRKEIININ